MQPVLSALGRRVREARPAAELDRERVGTRAGRMHVRAARPPRSRGQRRSVPHRDPADLPPHGLFRDLHVPAGAQGILLERLASAPVAGRYHQRAQPVHAGDAADSFRRSAKHYLGGLLHHAAPATAFARRPSTAIAATAPNSLAPDRATWCYDHRGVMIRVLGAPGDPATRIENRMGEPAANPYLYIASQIVAGLDGIDNARDPGPPDDEPYSPIGRCCRRA